MKLFLCLLLVHVVADFVLQNNKACREKIEKKWRSWYHYAHALIVFGLAWLAAWDVHFWWCALIIGTTHFSAKNQSSDSKRGEKRKNRCKSGDWDGNCGMMRTVDCNLSTV